LLKIYELISSLPFVFLPTGMRSFRRKHWLTPDFIVRTA